MKEITLEQCNALPISELLIATIEEPRDSNLSNELIRSDGTYIDLNGYGNKIYNKESLKFVEPFSDYYTEGSFKFCEFSEEFDNPFMRGIGIDFDSLDGIERYEKKVKKYYKQIESDY